MNDIKWRKFLIRSRQILGEGASDPSLSTSWCAYTTFSNLEHGVYYFNSGFPAEEECGETGVIDGSVRRQPIAYADLAHIVVPAVFYWERLSSDSFSNGFKEQNIDKLASSLLQDGIEHRMTGKILEIKLY